MHPVLFLLQALHYLTPLFDAASIYVAQSLDLTGFNIHIHPSKGAVRRRTWHQTDCTAVGAEELSAGADEDVSDRKSPNFGDAFRIGRTISIFLCAFPIRPSSANDKSNMSNFSAIQIRFYYMFEQKKNEFCKPLLIRRRSRKAVRNAD